MIPYSRPDVTDENIKAVESVLSSGFLQQVPKVPEFGTVASACRGVVVNCMDAIGMTLCAAWFEALQGKAASKLKPPR